MCFGKFIQKKAKQFFNEKLIQKIVHELNSLRDDFFVKHSFSKVLNSVYECFMDVYWLDIDSGLIDYLIKSAICYSSGLCLSVSEMEQYRKDEFGTL